MLMLHRDPKNAICKFGAHHLLSGAAEASNSSSAVTFAQNASCDKSKPIVVRDAKTWVRLRSDQKRETGFGPDKLLAGFNDAVLDRFNVCECLF
jgi:hypothetical protein